MDRWFVHVAELIGIFYAISMALRLAYQRSSDAYGCLVIVTFLCDSRSSIAINPESKKQVRTTNRPPDSLSSSQDPSKSIALRPSGYQVIMIIQGAMRQSDYLGRPRA
jgi:hypothetical protein